MPHFYNHKNTKDFGKVTITPKGIRRIKLGDFSIWPYVTMSKIRFTVTVEKFPQRNGINKKNFRQLCKKMHDLFHQRFSSTCCRVLIEPFNTDRKGRARFCSGLTGTTAAIAIELLLAARPDLARRLQADYLGARDSKISGFLKNFARYV